MPLGIDRLRSFPANTSINQVTVPIFRLDTLLEGHSLQKPILLKIDVQGYEDKVIYGSINILKYVDWVVMEVSFARLYEGEAEFLSLVKLMSSHGFVFVRPLNFHQSGNSLDIIEMDALFKRTN